MTWSQIIQQVWQSVSINRQTYRLDFTLQYVSAEGELWWEEFSVPHPTCHLVWVYLLHLFNKFDANDQGPCKLLSKIIYFYYFVTRSFLTANA